MLRLSDDQNRAAERVSEQLDKRTTELSDLKAKLLDQQAEADVAIYEMERFITKIKRVNVALSVEQGDTPEQEAKHNEKVKKAEDAFEQIKSSRNKIAEDIRCKASALKIDEMCKILTLTKVQIGPRIRKKKAATDTSSLTETNMTMRPASPDSPAAAAPDSP